MKSSWQTETGHLVCRWSDAGKLAPYDQRWMRETSNIQSSYLPPLPNFARHSPFGGASWFLPHSAETTPLVVSQCPSFSVSSI
jgi:hypothetical protein